MKISNQRMAYGEELVRIGRENNRIVVCEADLGGSTMSSLFEKAFPKRHFEMGIAEANMTSFAAGLSLTGRIAFTNSFAVFATGRAYDQIRQSIAIANLNVKIVGTAAGLSDFGDGATHQSVEDIAIMRAIPNLTVLVPADVPQLRSMMRWMVDNDGPMYLRVSRNDIPEITGDNCDPISPAIITDGRDIAIIACGTMVYAAVCAAEKLAKLNVSARVINVPCLKPLDEVTLRHLCAGVDAILTAEEHSVIGGLSAAVCWAFRKECIPIEAVAIADVFGQSAHDSQSLMAHYCLTEDDIAQAAMCILKGSI